MRAVVVHVGKEPEVVELSNNQDAAFAEMQRLVGGYLALTRRPMLLDIYCDEDGLSKNLPKNHAGLVGTFVVLGSSIGKEEMVGLTTHETEQVLHIFASSEP
jgi:Domain of unknown function (DUF3846)